MMQQARAAAVGPAEETVGGRLAAWWRRLGRRRRLHLAALDESFAPAEVKALIHYATEQGLDADGAIVCPLHDALVAYEQAAPETPERTAAARAILCGYARLSELTAPRGINGRTILYADTVAMHIGGLLLWGCLFAALAGGTEIVLILMGAGGDRLGAGGLGAWLAGTNAIEVLRYVNPFFWGGLGACVYLVKSVADRAAEFSFDKRKLQGLGSQIFLGAVFGATVVNGFDLVTQSLTGSAVAFVCGLGVKAVYAAFEALVDGIHGRISGLTDASRKTSATRAVEEYLRLQMAATRESEAPERHLALRGLLDELRAGR